MAKLNIALDIDDTIAGFIQAYTKKFGEFNDNVKITRNVYKLRKNKHFWETLPIIDTIDFDPHIYCTKRINSKIYTRNWLKNNGFPIKPIYQMYRQKGNKADLIKGLCDVLIDDSFYNVDLAIKSGLPALLIIRDHNKHINTPYKINTLNYKEIEKKYNELFRDNPKFNRI